MSNRMEKWRVTAFWGTKMSKIMDFAPLSLPKRPFLGFSNFAEIWKKKIFWGVGKKFWKIFFLVKISSKFIFFRKLGQTPQNIRKIDFRDLADFRHRDLNFDDIFWKFHDFSRNPENPIFAKNFGWSDKISDKIFL